MNKQSLKFFGKEVLVPEKWFFKVAIVFFVISFFILYCALIGIYRFGGILALIMCIASTIEVTFDNKRYSLFPEYITSKLNIVFVLFGFIYFWFFS